MFNNKVVMITGGTGNFGNYFTKYLFSYYKPQKVIIYSRDEYKQYKMKNRFIKHDNNLRYFIGDVRDEYRLKRAMNGVDYVIHAAALKQVSSCEFNPIEAIKTNINGAINVINAALDVKVKKVVSLSTDKSVNPLNLYGGTKMVSDRLFIDGNAYSGWGGTSFSVVRYGNVAGSRGSVIPYFKELIEKGEKRLPITDYRMTRFWISMEQSVRLVTKALQFASGGEIFVSKIPSFKIVDLAEAMLPGCELYEVGIRDGEKIQEVMITKEDSRRTYEYNNFYVVYPHYDWWDENNFISGGVLVEQDFEYSSSMNRDWLTVAELKRRLMEDLDIK